MTDHNQNEIRRYRVIAISHDQCVNSHGVSAIEDKAGALVYFGDHEAITSRLRAERDADKALALRCRTEMVEAANKETAALAKVRELEKSASRLEGAIREKQSELDHFRHCYETGVEVARQLKADNERLRGLLRDAAPLLPPDYPCPCAKCQAPIALAARIEQELGA